MIVPYAPPVAVEFLSPSLRRLRGTRAFELKFLVSEAKAREVQAWVASRMQLDPHGDPALGHAYRISTLYCDTPDLSVYHRAPLYGRRKFRVRRYGDSPGVFLERKTKWGD